MMRLKEKERKKNKRHSKWLLTLLFITPTLALADDDGSFQLTSILRGLIKVLDSSVAKIIFVLAVIAIGYAWLYLGRLPKDKAIGSIIGIGIVFSAKYIAQAFGLGI